MSAKAPPRTPQWLRGLAANKRYFAALCKDNLLELPDSPERIKEQQRAIDLSFEADRLEQEANALEQTTAAVQPVPSPHGGGLGWGQATQAATELTPADIPALLSKAAQLRTEAKQTYAGAQYTDSYYAYAAELAISRHLETEAAKLMQQAHALKEEPPCRP